VIVAGSAHELVRRPVASIPARMGARVETSDGRIEVSGVHVADSLAIVLASMAAAFSSSEGRREAIRLVQGEHGTSSEMLCCRERFSAGAIRGSRRPSRPRPPPRRSMQHGCARPPG
jgi:hypothetical protein